MRINLPILKSPQDLFTYLAYAQVSVAASLAVSPGCRPHRPRAFHPLLVVGE